MSVAAACFTPGIENGLENEFRKYRAVKGIHISFVGKAPVSRLPAHQDPAGFLFPLNLLRLS